MNSTLWLYIDFEMIFVIGLIFILSALSQSINDVLISPQLVDAGAGVNVQGRAGLTYEGGRALVTLQYDGEDWSVEEVGMTVWGGVGGPNAVGVDLLSLPKIGLNLYLRGELYPEPDEIAVTVVSPQDGATLDTNQPVTFNANAVGNPQLKLKAGVELTLRDGSVEENGFPTDPPEQRAFPETRSSNFGSDCDQAPINPSGNRYPCTADIRTG